MGGKVWSAEEEKYFWEVIVPQAPAGLDSVSKQAKKEAHTAWAPLSTQMEREMTKRLKPEEHLRRKYTPIGCYEHYFQNYVNRHYSPHAKALVLKYENHLKAAASPASPVPRAIPRDNKHTRPEPIRAPSRGKLQTAPKSQASHLSRHNDGAAFPMPQAPMPLARLQHAPSAMDVLCDAALATQMADSLEANMGDQQDKGTVGSSRQQGRRRGAVVNEDTNDAPEASRQFGSGSNPKAPREIRKFHRDQRRTRKAAHRQDQASDLESETAAPDMHSPPPTGLPYVQTGHYNGPMMYGPPPAYSGYHYSMPPGNHPQQTANEFQPHYAAHNNGFHPYGVPPHFGGVPGFNVHPHFAPGGPMPQYPVPYMGNYYTPGYVHNNGQGYGNGLTYMDGGMGGRESVSGQENGIDQLSGPSEEGTQSSDGK